jgi:transcriptional regulator with XRE-family HTH domain
MAANSKDFGMIIKQQRIAAGLTLRKLSDMSGVSSSHLGRIERGERFPSAYILQRIAKPLGFDESELFALAGYLSPSLSAEADMTVVDTARRLDPLVARMLTQEPLEVQRAVIALLNLLKSLARSL